jgi:hypothetical protein
MYSQRLPGETTTVNVISSEELTPHFTPESGGKKFIMAELRREDSLACLYKAEIEIFSSDIHFLNFLSIFLSASRGMFEVQLWNLMSYTQKHDDM